MRSSRRPLQWLGIPLHHIAPWAFFALFIGLGLGIYKDYGVNFDSLNQRLTGLVNAREVLAHVAPRLIAETAKGLPTLKDYVDRDYGAALELPLVVLEKALGFQDPREIFLFRHLILFLISVGALFSVFKVASWRFGDWRIGLLAAIVLILSPRLFADSFHNSKDGAFMAVFAMAMATTTRFVLRPTIPSATLNALMTAIAIDVRIIAIMLPLAATTLLTIRCIKRELPLRRSLAALLSYLLLTLIFVVALWPYLWTDPLGRFGEAFRNMSRFRWELNNLYMGQLVRSTDIPWHYVPVWIAITTPLLYLASFVAGAGAILLQVLRRGVALWSREDELLDILFVGLCVSPVIVAISMGSVLYDGWRQMYFIYPAFVLIALRGWLATWACLGTAPLFRLLLAVATATSLALTAAWMVRTHPLQNVYFNLLAGDRPSARWEYDYWGMANRKALEYILRHDQSPTIPVTTDAVTPLYAAFSMMPPDERRRLIYHQDASPAKYLVTNYRYTRTGDDIGKARARHAALYESFWKLEIDGNIVVEVFRLRGS